MHRGPSLSFYSIKVIKSMFSVKQNYAFPVWNFCHFFLSCAGAHFRSFFGHETFLSNRCNLLPAKLDKRHRTVTVCKAEASFCGHSLHFCSLSDLLRNSIPGQNTIYHISRMRPVAWDELFHPSHPGNMEAT